MKANFRLFVLIVLVLAIVLTGCMGRSGQTAVVQGKNASEILTTDKDGNPLLVEEFVLDIMYCDSQKKDGQWINCTGATATTVTREVFNKNTVNTEYIP